MNQAGADARRLLDHLAASHPDLLHSPQAEALRQVMVQNYHWDASGRLGLARARTRGRPRDR